MIGGTSLFGGRGVMLGTPARRADRRLLPQRALLAGVDDQYRVLAIGVLVIVAVAIDQWIRKVRA